MGLAVGHLHDMLILYRDLKATNVGFDASGVVKIFDFGLSRLLPKSEKQAEEEKRAARNRKQQGSNGQRPTNPPDENTQQLVGAKFQISHWHRRQNADPKRITEWQKQLATFTSL